ncbi:MAG: hypothetical protein ACRD0Z_04070 [Acidimicrobiales bacterium]
MSTVQIRGTGRRFGRSWRFGAAAVATAGTLLATGPLVSQASAAAPATAPTSLLQGLGRGQAPQTVTLPPAVVGRPYFAALPVPARTEGTSGSSAASAFGKPSSQSAKALAATRWRIASGTLPKGLSFNSRYVTGLPTAPATATLVLKPLSSGGTSTEAHLRIVTLTVTRSAAPASHAPKAAGTTATGTISGKVTSGSTPLHLACVTAVGQSGAAVTATTTKSGTYSLSLAPGRWELLFDGCANNDVSQWYPTQATQLTARALSITAGQTASASADLRPGGTVSGTVTVAGKAASSLEVCAYAESEDSVDGLSTTAEGAAATASGGAYSVTGLPNGTYDMYFVPCRASDNVQSSWWKNQADPTFAAGLTVKGGGTIAGISPDLQPAGQITGTVTSAATHKPLAGVCAYAVSVGYAFGGPATTAANGAEVGLAVTNPGGAYRVTALGSGPYLVEFFGCASGPAGNYLEALWHQAANFDATPPVLVTAGKTVSGVSIALRGGGAISGTATSAVSHLPLAHVCVLAASVNGEYGTETGPNGSYFLGGLTAGTYEAEFLPCYDYQNYLPVLWETGKAFSVRIGHVTAGISGALVAGGQFEGSVTSASGQPLTGVCALVEQTASGGEYGEEYGPVGFGGEFDIAGLPTGKFSIGLDGSCTNVNLSAQWWDKGKAVSVKAGGTVRGLSFALPAGAEITGSVKSSNGSVLSDICVLGQDSSSLLSFHETVTFNGKYELRGLPTGKYLVAFEPCLESQNYFTSGALVSVQAGKPATNVSVTLKPAAAITGTVTDNKGVPLTDICVTATQAFSANPIETYTFAGSYEISGLAQGTYEVEFTGCGVGYHNQWWKDASTQAKATQIVVAKASTVTGIDATLAPS